MFSVESRRSMLSNSWSSWPMSSIESSQSESFESSGTFFAEKFPVQDYIGAIGLILSSWLYTSINFYWSWVALTFSLFSLLFSRACFRGVFCQNLHHSRACWTISSSSTSISCKLCCCCCLSHVSQLLNFGSWHLHFLLFGVLWLFRPQALHSVFVVLIWHKS